MTLTTKTLRATVSGLLLTLLMACQGETNAQSVDESKYQPVGQQITVTTGDKIEVAELFWFGCGHCYSLEPALKEWKKIEARTVSTAHLIVGFIYILLVILLDRKKD